MASWRLCYSPFFGKLFLIDVCTTFDKSVTQGQQRAMSDFCIQFCTNPPSSFVLSDAWSEEWVLVHRQVVLRLLARVQPLARLQPLRDLYRLTPEEEVLLPHPPLAFGTYCHIDRIRIDFRLAMSASIQKPARENERNLLPGAFRRPCGVPGRF